MTTELKAKAWDKLKLATWELSQGTTILGVTFRDEKAHGGKILFELMNEAEVLVMKENP